MYTSKHFTTSRSVVTITVIALAAWGILGVTSLALAAPNKNIPVQVEFRDDENDMIMSDGGKNGGDASYTDGDEKVQTFIGRNCGQFLLDTNTSGNAGAGRTMTLDFGTSPADLPSSPFQPESAEIVTARPWYKQGNLVTYFVDLRKMPLPGEAWTEPYPYDDPDNAWNDDNPDGIWSAKLSLRLKFYIQDEMKGGKIYWVLHFGDVLWADPDGDMGSPVTVTRLDNTPEDHAQWTIESLSSDQARLEHHVNWGESIFMGYYSMPFKITITTLAPQQQAPPAPNLRSRLTSTWGSMKSNGE